MAAAAADDRTRDIHLELAARHEHLAGGSPVERMPAAPESRHWAASAWNDEVSTE